MSGQTAEEQDALWKRAAESERAAGIMMKEGLYDFAASRAYYAAFYAASAVLLDMGMSFRKHSAVLAAVNRHLIMKGVLDKAMGTDLKWLFELRSVGDYGMIRHVPRGDTERAITVAGIFIKALRNLKRNV